MIIKNIEQAKVKYIQDLKYNGKRFFIYFIANFTNLWIFGLLFLYIEHCYDVVAAPKSYRESSFVEICAERRRLLNQSDEPLSILSTNISDFHSKLKQICESDTTVDEIIKCEFNTKTFIKWGEYITSIQYTIGWGAVVTRSQLGRWVTTISIVPLITLNAVTYIYCGALTLTIIKLFIISFERKVFKRKIIVCFNRKLLACQFILMVCAVTGYTVFAMHSRSKELNLTDLVYSTVVTFTTIGFGDVMYNNRDQFAENFTLFIFAHQILFIVSFAMVTSCITAITEMISNRSNENKYREDNDVQTELRVDKKKKTKDIVISNNILTY